jgi:hypothetical protein
VAPLLPLHAASEQASKVMPIDKIVTLALIRFRMCRSWSRGVFQWDAAPVRRRRARHVEQSTHPVRAIDPLVSSHSVAQIFFFRRDRQL